MGVTLSRALEELYQKTEEPALKNNLALVVGAMRPNAVKTAQRIQDYSPVAAAKEEMKKEEKER